MCNYVREFGVFQESESLIQLALAATKTPWEQSHLYDRRSDSTLINVKDRLSQFKTLTDKNILDAAEHLVEAVSHADKEYTFMLRRDDVTIIHYDTGGFFKPHSDYVSLTSNAVEEFTLLLCLPTTNCTGGETCFHLNQYFTAESKSSVSPGHVVVFRKDILHEGKLVTSGIKEIITLNLYGMKRTCLKHVIFKCSDGGLFSVPFANIPPESVFGTLIQDLEVKDHAMTVIPIDETSDLFEPVHRVLMSCIVFTHDIDWDLMRKYNIDPSSVLTPGDDITPTSFTTREKATAHIVHTEDMTLYSSYELAKYHLHNNPDPNKILFQAIIIENGMIARSGSSGLTCNKIDMEVLVMAVTDWNNIFIERKSPSDSLELTEIEVSEQHLHKLIDEAGWCTEEIESICEKDRFNGKIQGVAENAMMNYATPYCLISFGKLTPSQILIEKLCRKTNEHYQEKDQESEEEDEESAEGYKESARCLYMESIEPMWFKLDEQDKPYGRWQTQNYKTGETYLCGLQTFAMYEKLRQMKVEEKLKNILKKEAPRMACSQTTDTYSDMLCNDKEYGRISLIFIGGIITLAL